MSTDTDAVSHAYEEAVFRQLAQEEGLINNRLSWLVASQSFLFTAYAIVLNGASSPPALGGAVLLAARQAQLLRIIPALGLATCGLIYLGVLAGVRVMVLLRRGLRPRHGGLATGRMTGPPLLPGTRTTHALGLAAPLLLPPLFLAAWAMLLWGS